MYAEACHLHMVLSISSPFGGKIVTVIAVSVDRQIPIYSAFLICAHIFTHIQGYACMQSACL